jgi:hypothetical protein
MNFIMVIQLRSFYRVKFAGKELWPTLRQYPNTFLEVLGKTAKLSVITGYWLVLRGGIV